MIKPHVPCFQHCLVDYNVVYQVKKNPGPPGVVLACVLQRRILFPGLPTRPAECGGEWGLQGCLAAQSEPTKTAEKRRAPNLGPMSRNEASLPELARNLLKAGLAHGNRPKCAQQCSDVYISTCRDSVRPERRKGTFLLCSEMLRCTQKCTATCHPQSGHRGYTRQSPSVPSRFYSR